MTPEGIPTRPVRSPGARPGARPSATPGQEPDLRLAFLGTPEPAAVALRALVAAGHEVVVVVTRADKRRGRRRAPEPSPVKAAALTAGLRVTSDLDAVVDSGAELGVVVAYGRIIRPPVLGALPLINVHFSLLPRWRGAAPVERAVLAGDARTGVCLMALEAGLDTGPVYLRDTVAIGDSETADELMDRLARIGADLLVAGLADGLGRPEPQVGEPTYAAKIETSDRELHWDRSAASLHRVVRVGRAWTTFRGRRLLVGDARPTGEPAPAAPGLLRRDVVATADGGLRLLVVQPEGRASVDAGAWLRGARPGPDERLGLGPGPQA